jgi:hypothetical protein
MKTFCTPMFYKFTHEFHCISVCVINLKVHLYELVNLLLQDTFWWFFLNQFRVSFIHLIKYILQSFLVRVAHYFLLPLFPVHWNYLPFFLYSLVERVSQHRMVYLTEFLIALLLFSLVYLLNIKTVSSW